MRTDSDDLPAPPVPPLRPGQPPIALLVDYDGTIATTDVADTILYRFIGERYRADDEAHDAGTVGSRTLYTSQGFCPAIRRRSSRSPRRSRTTSRSSHSPVARSSWRSRSRS
jgi:hypothetical protein